MRINKTGLPWAVLNYAVTEPNEWTASAIAKDLGVKPSAVYGARKSLHDSGLIVLGPDAENKKHNMLMPTPSGVELLYRTIGE